MSAPDVFMKNLDVLMKKAKMRPIDLARASGLRPQEINAYLHEGRLPSIEKLDSFASAFGVSVADLFSTSEVPEPKIHEMNSKDLLIKLRERIERLEERDRCFLRVLDIAENAHLEGKEPNLKEIHRILMEFMQYPVDYKGEPEKKNTHWKAAEPSPDKPKKK
jgi:transcriptional regulator with XRE-family HTH domain